MDTVRYSSRKQTLEKHWKDFTYLFEKNKNKKQKKKKKKLPYMITQRHLLWYLEMKMNMSGILSTSTLTETTFTIIAGHRF